MDVPAYRSFVQKTNQFSSRDAKERRDIAFYGLVSEIGSLVSAVKKKLLAEGGNSAWNAPNDEIKEELGDAFWYAFASAIIANDSVFDVLSDDIRELRDEIGSSDDRASRIALALDPSHRASFLEESRSFPSKPNYDFDEYQQLAFKTARTDGRVLIRVCVAVLYQLAGELLRPTLPLIEQELNKNIADRPTNKVLGEICWHLSAVASLYELSLSNVILANRDKVAFRQSRETPTPLHDAGRNSKEQFPREFNVSFIRVGPGRSRMYFDGKPLGDDLTDNAHENDGYRFHDVIHLALIAHLGWSPVIRGLMKRKRKTKLDAFDRTDEVEDGGRAQVVEELVIKAIHSEGEKLAEAEGRCVVGKPTQLFPRRSQISFRLLKTLQTYVEDLEVYKNKFWEWEDAIFSGCEMFALLSEQEQGTIHVDLNKRALTFKSMVSPDIHGIIVGAGLGVSSSPPGEVELRSLSSDETLWASSQGLLAETVAAKHAVLSALGIDASHDKSKSEIDVRLDAQTRIHVRAKGKAQQRAWSLNAIDYKASFAKLDGQCVCSALAVADVRDLPT